jgi:hypothetical protein
LYFSFGRDGHISVAWPFSFRFVFLFFFWHPDRTPPSRLHYSSPLPLFVSPLFHLIWSCMGGTCWRLWVARDSNGLSLFCWHDFSFPMGVEIFWPWMFCGHRVWGLLPVRDFIDYPIFGVALSKLFFLKSSNTRIAWHLLLGPIRFDFSVVCLAEIKAPNLLLFRTSLVVITLVIFWILVKFYVVWCYCCCCCDVVVVKFGVVFLLYCFVALFVGSCTMTNVIFIALYGFCLPLCRVVELYCVIF